MERIVIATDASGQSQSACADSSGVFTLQLTTGTYTITGNSPAFGEGQSICRAE